MAESDALRIAIDRARSFAGTWEDQQAEVDEESRLTVPDLLILAEVAERYLGGVPYFDIRTPEGETAFLASIDKGK